MAEILRIVFKPDAIDFDDMPIVDVAGRAAVASVCHHWANLVISNPGFWNSIYNFNGRNICELELRRSEGAPLDIYHVVYAEMDELIPTAMLELVGPKTASWRLLSITGNPREMEYFLPHLQASAPVLEALCLDGSWTGETLNIHLDGFHNLKRLKLLNVFLLSQPSLPNLTTLMLGGALPSGIDVADTLNNCPALRNLELHCGGIMSSKDIILGELLDFSFRMALRRQSEAVLRTLQTPKLRRLQLGAYWSDAIFALCIMPAIAGAGLTDGHQRSKAPLWSVLRNAHISFIKVLLSSNTVSYDLLGDDEYMDRSKWVSHRSVTGAQRMGSIERKASYISLDHYFFTLPSTLPIYLELKFADLAETTISTCLRHYPWVQNIACVESPGWDSRLLLLDVLSDAGICPKLRTLDLGEPVDEITAEALDALKAFCTARESVGFSAPQVLLNMNSQVYDRSKDAFVEAHGVFPDKVG